MSGEADHIRVVVCLNDIENFDNFDFQSTHELEIYSENAKYCTWQLCIRIKFTYIIFIIFLPGLTKNGFTVNEAIHPDTYSAITNRETGEFSMRLDIKKRCPTVPFDTVPFSHNRMIVISSGRPFVFKGGFRESDDLKFKLLALVFTLRLVH